MRNKIPNKQIGWSEQSNMIYDVLREWNALNNELYLKTCCTTDTTTTDGPTPPPPSTTTTTTTSFCCTASTLEVNVTVPDISVTTITIEGGDAWYDVGSLGLPIDSSVSPRLTSLMDNAAGTLAITVDNIGAETYFLYVYLNCAQVGSCCVIPADTTGHVCTFADFIISDYTVDCMKIEVTNVSCT